MLLLGRRAAALIYALAALLVPVWIVGNVVTGHLPHVGPCRSPPLGPPGETTEWAFGDTSADVPIPALGANVIWNLATNTLLGIGLCVAAVIG